MIETTPTAPWPPTGVERPDHKLYTLLRRTGLTPEAAQQEIDTYTQTILAGQGAPAIDRAGLRDRIAEVLAAADGVIWGPGHSSLHSGLTEDYHQRADAVLAVLPAPAVDVADLRDRITTAISKWHRDPEQSLYSQGADAVLAVLAAEAQQPTPAETEERRRCAHTDVLYGRCVRYLDDHDGDCWHEHYPAASAPIEEPK